MCESGAPPPPPLNTTTFEMRSMQFNTNRIKHHWAAGDDILFANTPHWHLVAVRDRHDVEPTLRHRSAPSQPGFCGRIAELPPETERAPIFDRGPDMLHRRGRNLQEEPESGCHILWQSRRCIKQNAFLPQGKSFYFSDCKNDSMRAQTGHLQRPVCRPRGLPLPPMPPAPPPRRSASPLVAASAHRSDLSPAPSGPRQSQTCVLVGRCHFCIQLWHNALASVTAQHTKLDSLAFAPINRMPFN